jgi:cytidylate kinase
MIADILPNTLQDNSISKKVADLPHHTFILTGKCGIEAVTSIINNLYQAGNVVIIGRGANVILADAPGVIHVGMLAPLEVRVATIMERERLTREEAEAYVEEVEQARIRFFRKFFKVNPNDPSLYHLMLNLGQMQPELAAEVIACITLKS